MIKHRPLTGKDFAEMLSNDDTGVAKMELAGEREPVYLTINPNRTSLPFVLMPVATVERNGAENGVEGIVPIGNTLGRAEEDERPEPLEAPTPTKKRKVRKVSKETKRKQSQARREYWEKRRSQSSLS